MSFLHLKENKFDVILKQPYKIYTIQIHFSAKNILKKKLLSMKSIKVLNLFLFDDLCSHFKRCYSHSKKYFETNLENQEM